MSYIVAEDLLFYKEDDKIMSGGFNVSSIMMKNGISPMNTTGGSSKQDKEKSKEMGEMYDNLAIPAGLLYQAYSSTGGYRKFDFINTVENPEDNIITEDIHDKLVQLIEYVPNPKKYSKKERKTTAKKTKKNI
jgi:hypothetical protein